MHANWLQGGCAKTNFLCLGLVISALKAQESCFHFVARIIRRCTSFYKRLALKAPFYTTNNALRSRRFIGFDTEYVSELISAHIYLANRPPSRLIPFISAPSTCIVRCRRSRQHKGTSLLNVSHFTRRPEMERVRGRISFFIGQGGPLVHQMLL